MIDKIKKELTLLRDNITARERSMLDLDRFDPADLNQCIYGQITGSCTSKRAMVLLDICINPENYILNENFGKKAGKLPKSSNDTRNAYDITYFSPLEEYILSVNIEERDDIFLNIFRFLKKRIANLDFIK